MIGSRRGGAAAVRLVLMSAGSRLALAAALSGLLWLGFLWATG